MDRKYVVSSGGEEPVSETNEARGSDGGLNRRRMRRKRRKIGKE